MHKFQKFTSGKENCQENVVLIDAIPTKLFYTDIINFNVVCRKLRGVINFSGKKRISTQIFVSFCVGSLNGKYIRLK